MKKFISLLLAFACLLIVPSCTKSLTKTIPGTYHFKISGNISAECVDPDYAGLKRSLIVHNEAGQMHILNNDEGGYIITMSVMLSSYSLVFKGSLDKSTGKIVLEKGTGILILADQGSSGSITSTAPAVQIDLSGSGKMYDNSTIIIKLKPESNFALDTILDSMTLQLNYKAITDDVICIANKE